MQHWNYEIQKTDFGTWYVMNSPTMMAVDVNRPIAAMLNSYKELKLIEARIQASKNIQGWIAHTEIDNTKMIKILTRIGARPLKVDVKNDLMWFWKSVKEF